MHRNRDDHASCFVVGFVKRKTSACPKCGNEDSCWPPLKRSLPATKVERLPSSSSADVSMKRRIQAGPTIPCLLRCFRNFSAWSWPGCMVRREARGKKNEKTISLFKNWQSFFDEGFSFLHSKLFLPINPNFECEHRHSCVKHFNFYCAFFLRGRTVSFCFVNTCSRVKWLVSSPRCSSSINKAKKDEQKTPLVRSTPNYIWCCDNV